MNTMDAILFKRVLFWFVIMLGVFGGALGGIAVLMYLIRSNGYFGLIVIALTICGTGALIAGKLERIDKD